MSGSNTIGLGLGVVILIVLWTVTAFLWVLLSRSQTALRTAVTCLSVILTIGMFLIPTSDDTSSTQQEKKHAPYDYMFIGRAVLIILLAVSVIAAVGIHLGQFWSVKVHASNPVPKKRMQQSPFLVDFKS